MRKLIERFRGENGQALVELAFVIPLLLLFLFAIIDFGLALNQKNQDTNIANIAVREAAVIGSSTSGASCTLNGTTTTYTNLADWTNCESLATGGPALASVCVYDTLTSSTGTTYASGDPVEVKVTSSFSWLKLIAGDAGGAVTTLGANATMREEGQISSGAATPFLTNAATVPRTWPSLISSC